MRALLLPTNESGIEEIRSELRRKGHELIAPGEDKERFFRELGRCDVAIALGKLTPIGVWFWGYCHAKRKKVLAMRGVDPCPVSRTIRLGKWLKDLPEQLSLFPLEESLL